MRKAKTEEEAEVEWECQRQAEQRGAGFKGTRMKLMPNLSTILMRVVLGGQEGSSSGQQMSRLCLTGVQLCSIKVDENI